MIKLKRAEALLFNLLRSEVVTEKGTCIRPDSKEHRELSKEEILNLQIFDIVFVQLIDYIHPFFVIDKPIELEHGQVFLKLDSMEKRGKISIDHPTEKIFIEI